MDNLRAHFENMPAVEVLQILCKAFPKDGMAIKFCHSGRIYLITELLIKYTESNLECPADLIGPLTFFGGPPAATKNYTGSLLTILLDQILLAWYLRGDYIDLVEKFPDAPARIRA